MSNYPLIPGTLSSNCWPSSPQTLYNEMFSKGRAQVPGLEGVIVSDTTPAVADRDKVWFKLDGSGVLTRPYYYASGEWLAAHPDEPSSGKRILFVGDSSSVETLDGGESATVSDTTGPFWEIDTEFAARFPIGVGTTTNGTGVSVTDKGGADEVTLTTAQMPAHTHGPDTTTMSAFAGVSTTTGAQDGATVANGLTSSTITGETGGDEAHNNLPPYYGVYFIKRTIRKYWVG